MLVLAHRDVDSRIASEEVTATTASEHGVRGTCTPRRAGPHLDDLQLAIEEIKGRKQGSPRRPPQSPTSRKFKKQGNSLQSTHRDDTPFWLRQPMAEPAHPAALPSLATRACSVPPTRTNECEVSYRGTNQVDVDLSGVQRGAAGGYSACQGTAELPNSCRWRGPSLQVASFQAPCGVALQRCNGSEIASTRGASSAPGWSLLDWMDGDEDLIEDEDLMAARSSALSPVHSPPALTYLTSELVQEDRLVPNVCLLGPFEWCPAVDRSACVETLIHTAVAGFLL